jgi:hypothetical protein
MLLQQRQATDSEAALWEAASARWSTNKPRDTYFRAAALALHQAGGSLRGDQLDRQLCILGLGKAWRSNWEQGSLKQLLKNDDCFEMTIASHGATVTLVESRLLAAAPASEAAAAAASSSTVGTAAASSSAATTAASIRAAALARWPSERPLDSFRREAAMMLHRVGGWLALADLQLELHRIGKGKDWRQKHGSKRLYKWFRNDACFIVDAVVPGTFGIGLDESRLLASAAAPPARKSSSRPTAAAADEPPDASAGTSAAAAAALAAGGSLAGVFAHQHTGAKVLEVPAPAPSALHSQLQQHISACRAIGLDLEHAAAVGQPGRLVALVQVFAPPTGSFGAAIYLVQVGRVELPLATCSPRAAGGSSCTACAECAAACAAFATQPRPQQSVSAPHSSWLPPSCLAHRPAGP